MSMATRRRGNMKAAKSDGKVYYRYYDGDRRGEYVPGTGLMLIYPRTDMILEAVYDPKLDRTKVKCVRTDPKDACIINIGIGKGGE